MNDISKREFIALQILNGACAGDWKFDIPQGLKWETVAAFRSFEIADEFLKASSGNIPIIRQEPKVETVAEEKIKKVKREKI